MPETPSDLTGMAPLLDLLTTLIAFSVIMLLLSLVVTALVQGAQAALSVRATNLRRGLAGLLEAALPADAKDRKQWAKSLAREVIQHPLLTPGEGKLSQRRGTSWITRDELDKVLQSLDGVPWSSRRVALDWFDRFEASSSKRFLSQVRRITIVCSLAVAVLFQVDAVETLRQLSADAETRERMAGAAESLLARAEEDLRELGDPRATLGEALAVLEERFPEEGERIEEVTGESGNRREVVEDLRLVLGPGARTDEIVETFERIVDQRTAERGRRAEAIRDRALSTGARLGIEPWPSGWGFYFGSWDRLSNWIGVLLTTLLLSLGAPFWFQQLRNLVNLRDRLSDLGSGGAAEDGSSPGASSRGSARGGRRRPTPPEAR